MTLKNVALALCLASFAMTGNANAAGCLKGAAVGGVGGHFVGKGHAVLGAAGGCLVGRHMANKKAKDEAARQQNQQAQNQQSPQDSVAR
nr:hypothetical protein [Caballeronia sp. Lep1P3]